MDWFRFVADLTKQAHGIIVPPLQGPQANYLRTLIARIERAQDDDERMRLVRAAVHAAACYALLRAERRAPG